MITYLGLYVQVCVYVKRLVRVAQWCLLLNMIITVMPRSWTAGPVLDRQPGPDSPVRSSPADFSGPEFPVRSGPAIFAGPEFPVRSGPATKSLKKLCFRGSRGQNRNLCEKCFIMQWFLPQTELPGPSFGGSRMSENCSNLQKLPMSVKKDVSEAPMARIRICAKNAS